MKLTRENGRFIFHCQISERFPAREAGFQFNNQAAPGVWSTDSARRALKLAAYADDELRAQILEAAKDEPDPERITLTFDGQTYKFFAPFQYRLLAKNAGFLFAKHPQVCWWSCSFEAAVMCFNNCAQYEGLFECDEALKQSLSDQLRERNGAIEDSKALDADIDLPCPEGLSYLPFQRAGIYFCLKVMGEI